MIEDRDDDLEGHVNSSASRTEVAREGATIMIRVDACYPTLSKTDIWMDLTA
jgi:hypothetical protein